MTFLNLLLIAALTAPLSACKFFEKSGRAEKYLTVQRTCGCTPRLNQCKVIANDGKAYKVVGQKLSIGDVVDRNLIVSEISITECHNQ